MAELFISQLADGAGAPVVLSHALGLDHSMWAGISETWPGKRPVLVYDHRGHGRSPVTPGPYTMVDLVDDAVQVIEQWGRGPVVWIGLSMGGMVGQGLAIRRPDLVRGLVLAHTVAKYPPEGRAVWQQRIAAVSAGGMDAVADTVLQRYLSQSFRQEEPRVASELRGRLLCNDPQGYIACCHAVAGVDWLDELHRIECPTLVLAGAHDVGAPPAMARAIHERIHASRMEVFEHASHLSPVEQPEAFRQSMDHFIESVDLGPDIRP